MSLQLAAKHLAAHGRGPDTTLVHMTPGEVASLQSLAQQHGGSLTINPHTGLPEAGFLSALLPMAAGAGLAAMGMPQGYAALAVGATSALTNGGDLKKGLMNGISAYGGAGMAESFMGAGLGTMGGSMGASSVAPATVLEAPVGATSPYALTGSTAVPSTAGYSLGESSSYLNQPLPSLVSTAPAEAVKQAAAATPAAQQAAALQGMDMGQRWDALKAGATGTNALNYIKANPFTSLGVATAAMTPDEANTPQKATDTDRGARAGMQYHPGWSNPLPRPNMQGIEQTYNRPYYAAEGGITHMAEGGITPLLDQEQLFADYLKRVSGGTGTRVAPVTEPEVKVTPETPEVNLPFLETPVASNTRERGGMSQEQRDEKNDPNAWSNQTPSQQARFYAYNPGFGQVTQAGLGALQYSTPGFLSKLFSPGAIDKYMDIAKGYDPANATPVTEGYTRVSPTDPYHLTVKEADALSNDQSNEKIARIIAEAQAAANGSPAPSSVPTPTITAAPEGTPASGPTPQGDPAQQRGQGGSDNGGRGINPGGYSNSMTQSGDNAGGSQAADGGLSTLHGFEHMAHGGNVHGAMRPPPAFFQSGKYSFHPPQMYADGGELDPYNLGSYSDGGRLLKGPGDGVSDSIPATIGKGRPARLADGEFVVPARIVSEIGNGSTEAGARKLYAMMDRIQAGRKKSVGKGKVAVNSRADKYLPA